METETNTGGASPDETPREGAACTFPRCAAGMGVDGRHSACCEGDPEGKESNDGQD